MSRSVEQLQSELEFLKPFQGGLIQFERSLNKQEKFLVYKHLYGFRSYMTSYMEALNDAFIELLPAFEKSINSLENALD